MSAIQPVTLYDCILVK